MRVILESKLCCSYETTVNFVQKSALLHHVAYPLVIFTPLEGSFPEKWRIGTFWTKLSLFGFFPFPQQAIVISFPNESNQFCLRDNGFSSLIKKWDHYIRVRSISQTEVLYQDTIDVKAGLLTPFVWVFAFSFYSYRQFRLRRLAKKAFQAI